MATNRLLVILAVWCLSFLLTDFVSSTTTFVDGGTGTAEGLGDDKLCRVALLSYSSAASDLLNCTLFSLFPSNICIDCRDKYLKVVDAYALLAWVPYLENVTCKGFYLHTEKYLHTDAHTLRKTFTFATDDDGAFATARCSDCYVNADVKRGQLKEETFKYLSLYRKTRSCFDLYLNDSNGGVGDSFSASHILCRRCKDKFESTQEYLSQTILLNSTSFGAFLDICLDISDRAQELNRVYEEFSCKQSQTLHLDKAARIALGVVLCLVVTACHVPMTMFKITKKVSFFRAGLYVKSSLDGPSGNIQNDQEETNLAQPASHNPFFE